MQSSGVALTVLVLALSGCESNLQGGAGGATSAAATSAGSTAAESTAESSSSQSGSTGTGLPIDPCGDSAVPYQDLGTGLDPAAGVFTLNDALAGLAAGPGPLRAIIDTDEGSVSCELFETVAPNGVANFVGLARGRRPFKETLTPYHWVVGKRFYDGLIFHRVINDFMCQGGDPKGNGSGDAGYSFADELGNKSHIPGTLAYANSGPNSNGSQFYIVAEQPATFLDGMYTIFGLCSPISVPKAITEVPTDVNDRPLTPIHMNRICITRAAP